MKSKRVVNYYLYGFIHCCDYEDPVFQFESKSIDFIYEFVGSCDFDCIDLEIIRIFDDGSSKELDVYKLKELYEVNHNEI